MLIPPQTIRGVKRWVREAIRSRSARASLLASVIQLTRAQGWPMQIQAIPEFRSWLFLVGSLFLSPVAVCLLVLPAWSAAPWETMPFDERVKAALDIQKDTTKTVFEVTFLVLGALWGMFLAKEGAERSLVRSLPDALLFTLINLLLAGSIIFGVVYTRDVSASLVDSAVLFPAKSKSTGKGQAGKASAESVAGLGQKGPEKEDPLVADLF